MTGPANPIQTTSSAPLAGQSQSASHAAIARAAERTGVDFGYLLAQAQIESGMNPRAEARTSSATGLFQFIDQTWLATLDKHGEGLGYGHLANAIQTSGGRARITDPAMRDAIMALRFDPQASSLMAGALANDNSAALQPVLGRKPDTSELYLAHFLGAGDASRFLSTLTSNPDLAAASLLPRAASSNRAIFYERSGGARSVAEVMALIRDKVEGALPTTGPTSGAISGPQSASTPVPMPAISPSPSLPGFTPPIPQPAQGVTHYAPSRNAPSLPELQPLPSMASTLRSSFGLGADSNDDAVPGMAHIRSAYARLEAFGL